MCAELDDGRRASPHAQLAAVDAYLWLDMTSGNVRRAGRGRHRRPWSSTKEAVTRAGCAGSSREVGLLVADGAALAAISSLNGGPRKAYAGPARMTS